jgi:hypothetical protein
MEKAGPLPFTHQLVLPISGQFFLLVDLHLCWPCVVKMFVNLYRVLPVAVCTMCVLLNCSQYYGAGACACLCSYFHTSVLCVCVLVFVSTYILVLATLREMCSPGGIWLPDAPAPNGQQCFAGAASCFFTAGMCLAYSPTPQVRASCALLENTRRALAYNYLKTLSVCDRVSSQLCAIDPRIERYRQLLDMSHAEQ